MSREPRLAEEFIREKEQINVESRRSRKARLEKPLPVQSASSNVVDMINCLRRINSQLTSLAYAIVRDSTRSSEIPVHSPEAEVEEAWPAEDSAKREAKQPASAKNISKCESRVKNNARRGLPSLGYILMRGESVHEATISVSARQKGVHASAAR
jgi:hypothetical protein